MSNLLSSKDFGSKIYNRFPLKYREDDVLQSHALKRYIEALSDGGFSHTIEDLNGITTLINPDKIDSKVLPLLFQQFGFDVFNGIPEQYLRYFLPKLGEAYSLKGSLGVVEFITSSLSGVKVSLDVITDEFGNQSVDIKFEMDYNLGGYFPDAGQFTRILNKFLPFYLSRTLMYAYMFYENQVLRNREQEGIKINDLRKESISFASGRELLPMTNEPNKLLNSSFILNEPKIETDYYKDKISYLFNEVFALKKDAIELLDVVKTKLIEEELNIAKNESFEDTIVENVQSDSLVIGSRGKEVNATLGVGIMGKAVLGIDTNFSYFIEDTYTERISCLYNETPNFEVISEDTISISEMTPMEESLQITTIDNLTDGVLEVYNETTSILSKGVGGTDNSVLGEALLGVSPLAESGDYADVVKDHITIKSVEDYGSIVQPKATFTNSDYGTLNNGFKLNDFTNVYYDVVSYSDGRKSYIIHN